VSISEQRDGVDLTNLDQPLGPATKRDLVDYLEAVADRMLPDSSGGHSPCCECCAGERRSCRRTFPSTPRTGSKQSASGRRAPKREVRYAVCDNRRTCCGSRTNAPSNTTRHGVWPKVSIGQRIWFSIWILPTMTTSPLSSPSHI